MADVAAGKTTLFEHKGNKAADGFAKMGAKLHGVTAVDGDVITGLGLIAREEAAWLGHLHA